MQFTAAGPTYFVCVAISTTPDPTGTYYRYAISTGSNFPDYPKVGVGRDAYYFATRDFANGATFVGMGVYALNRAQAVAGGPATVISFLVPPGGTPYNIGDGLQPADIDGSTLPPPGRPHYYAGTMDQGGPYGAPQDALTLWKFQADFVTPANSTFTLANTLPVAAFDSIFPCTPTSRACIPQLGTANKLDILSYRQRPMHRLAYRNYGTHESLVTNQSVEAVAGIAGLRWYEVRSPNSSPVIYQQGTYAPGATDGIHRWMGSIAMDANGNMALGYSASNATIYPSIWYTGRLAGDPLGTMPQGEGVVINGTGAQTGSNRWGDYTSMNVDPSDDCTFWYVNQYIPTTSSVGWRLRIGSFKFPSCIAGGGGFAPGTTYVTSATNATPTVITSLAVVCPASGVLVVTGSGESAAKSSFAGNAFVGVAYSIALNSTATDNGNVVQSSALAKFNGDANRDFLNIQRFDNCTPGQSQTYALTAYATTPQTDIANGSFVWNGRLTAVAGPASSSFAAATTFVTSATNATPTVITTLPVVCPASGSVAVTGSGESAAQSTFAGNAFMGLAYSISRDSTATDNANVVQSSALAVFNGDANRDFLNVQRVDSCTPGASNTYRLTAYATTPQTGIGNQSFVWNGRLVATTLPTVTSFAGGTSFVDSASNAAPKVVTSVNIVCPASGTAIVTGSGESAAQSNFAGNAFIGLAYSIARDSTATDNGNVVQSSALAAFNGDANRDFLNVQRADSCTPGQAHTYFLTAYATTPQTNITNSSFVWNGRLVAILPP